MVSCQCQCVKCPSWKSNLHLEVKGYFSLKSKFQEIYKGAVQLVLLNIYSISIGGTLVLHRTKLLPIITNISNITTKHNTWDLLYSIYHLLENLLHLGIFLVGVALGGRSVALDYEDESSDQQRHAHHDPAHRQDDLPRSVGVAHLRLFQLLVYGSFVNDEGLTIVLAGSLKEDGTLFSMRDGK